MNNVNCEDARKFLEMLDSMPGNYTKLREQLAAKAYPEKIINLTGHDVTVLDDDNQVIAVFPKQSVHNVCTAALENLETRTICGVPVHYRTCADVYNLPEPEPNVFYIVSSITAYCVKEDRDDLLTISGQVKDAMGRIIGCRRLIRMVR